MYFFGLFLKSESGLRSSEWSPKSNNKNHGVRSRTNSKLQCPANNTSRHEMLSPPYSKSEILLSPQIEFLQKSTYPLFVTFLDVTPDSLEIFA